jgi:hypothetical protein
MKRACQLALAAVAFASIACDNSSTAPSDSASSSLHISSPSPATGSTIHVTVGAAPGFFIPRGSGQISIPITVTSDRQLPWAQLFVYMMTADNPQSYCAQNLPDAPGWEPFVKGQTASVTITGLQVYQLPCDVTAIRAYLTTRDIRRGGSLTPPTPDETVASGVLTTSYQLRP